MEGFSSKPLVEPLNDENFPVWSVRMRAALTSHGLWKYVSKGIEEGPATLTTDRETAEEADQKALAFIILSVQNHHLSTVTDCITSKAAWEALSRVHKAKSAAKQIHLHQELTTIDKLPLESITQNTARAVALRDQLTQRLLERLSRIGS